MDNIAEYIVATATIGGLIWAIVKVVVKLTPSKKDDAFVEKAGPSVDGIVNGLGGNKSEKP